jgi:hypothetical protein
MGEPRMTEWGRYAGGSEVKGGTTADMERPPEVKIPASSVVRCAFVVHSFSRTAWT